MPAPVVLFCACDRHNLGDLLFPHVASALLPGRELVVAGLADRDLRVFGGHRVQALHRLGTAGRLHGAHLLHAGGEVLTCDAHQAAAMLLRPQDLDGVLATLAHEPGLAPDWREAMVGTASPVPYVAARTELTGIDRLVFAGVGGVALAGLAPIAHAHVLRCLADADATSVRDARTLAHLHAAGIEAALVPDPVVTVARLFGERIREHARQCAVAAAIEAWPQGYVAVQLSAAFGDDASLAVAAGQLARTAAETGLGLVLFRAGAAPWHDDLEVLVRLAARLPPRSVRVFESLDAWDICALIASARAEAGSSLHAAIVASAFGVPATGLVCAGGDAQSDKLRATLETWHGDGELQAWPIDRLAEGIAVSLRGDGERRHAAARERAGAYCTAFERLAAALD